jgi:peptidoglycan/LPS O-acetylase OafA/YrhL
VPARLPLIDALKALASQLIVLHHLAFYGPMSDAVRPWAGPLVDALSAHGRLAVQVFLVVAGFLAVRGLAPGGVPKALEPVALIRRRWVRLAGPYLAALAIAVTAAALGRALTDHDTVPDAPTLVQLLVNAAMLQDILGHDALSAGIWYVAIDLQLYVLLTVLLWLAHRSTMPGAGPVLVIALGAASLLIFNRDADWDAWGLYFFGAYALGALAGWAGPTRGGRAAFAALVVLGAVSLALDFRIRIAVALATAMLLAWAMPRGLGARRLAWPPIEWLGRISYSVFLVHYPVCMLIGAAAARWFPDAPVPAAAGLVLAWIGSTVAGALFHRWVEAPLSARSPGRSTAPAPRAAPVELGDTGEPDDETAPAPTAPR